MSFNSQKSSKEIPDIPIELAEKILTNVFNECNKEPNKTPISVLMRKHKYSSWRNWVRTKCWTLKNSKKSKIVYLKEQKRKVLKFFDQCKSIFRAIQ